MAREGGFSLIELMIAVAIIGVLVAVAVPKYSNCQCKAKQSEVKIGLRDILRLQEVYYGETNHYASNLDDLNYVPKPSGRYSFSMIASSPSTFTVEAVGVVNNKTDTWRLNEQGTVWNTQSGCGN